MIDLLRYDGKRVVVTGAASGIGQATAEILGQLGAEVHALDLHPPAVETAGFVTTDLRDPDAIDHAVQQIGGPVDALFNCAGIAGTHPPVDILVCNFCGTRHLTERVVPLMPAGSAIATVSSVAGRSWHQTLDRVRPLVDTRSFADGRRWCEENAEHVEMAYGFSKRALTLAILLQVEELAVKGIRTNIVSPGATETAMWTGFVDRMNQEMLDEARGLSGRTARPEEQAHALVFLNSSAASYVNGADFVVDGGREAAKLAQAVREGSLAVTAG